LPRLVGEPRGAGLQLLLHLRDALVQLLDQQSLLGKLRFVELALIGGVPDNDQLLPQLVVEESQPAQFLHEAAVALLKLAHPGGHHPHLSVEPVGLGARDTLRLEMKYCLYGNDIDATTNPLEADLGWITKLRKGDFIGRDAILKVKEEGMSRKLIGYQVLGKVIPRHGYPIYHQGEPVGLTTSGNHSPMLGHGIGMGYVPVSLAEPGTELQLNARGGFHPIRVVPTPFYHPPEPPTI